MSTDRIEKQIVLQAPRARVWRAIVDPREFGAWFGVALEGPFEVGKPTRGRITNPAFTHLVLEVTVETVEPERRLAFRWHPYAIDPNVDYASEPTTLVTFTLEEAPEGTRLVVVESGFDAIPEHRRAEAFRMNDGGWAAQVENVARHVAS